MATPSTDRALVTYPDGAWRYPKAGTEQEALAFVIDMNVRRRQLSGTQLAMIGARLANMGQGARTDLASIGAMSKAEAGDMIGGRTNAQIWAMFSVDRLSALKASTARVGRPLWLTVSRRQIRPRPRA